MVFTALTNDELYDINGGCWWHLRPNSITVIGDIYE